MKCEYEAKVVADNLLLHPDLPEDHCNEDAEWVVTVHHGCDILHLCGECAGAMVLSALAMWSPGIDADCMVCVKRMENGLEDWIQARPL